MSKFKFMLPYPRQSYIFTPYSNLGSVPFRRTILTNSSSSRLSRLYSSSSTTGKIAFTRIGLPLQHSFLKPPPSSLPSLSKLLWLTRSVAGNTLVLHNSSSAVENPINSAINMSTAHLAKGSSCPPLTLTEGKIRLYSMLMCPFAQRARLVAEAKSIPYEVVNCNLKEKPEWLLEKNPQGEVPVLETQDGKILYESIIVADYLDEVFSSRPLYDKDSYKKAQDKLFIEKFRNVVSRFYGILFGFRDSVPNDEMKERITKFVDSLKVFEVELGKRGSLFFAGEQPGMLDYTIWPWFERIPVIKLKLPDLFDYEAAKKQNPNLENWRQAMKKDPVVAKLLIAPERHLEFMIGFLAGSPDYNSL